MTLRNQRIYGRRHQHIRARVEQRGVIADTERHIGSRLQRIGESGNQPEFAEVFETHSPTPSRARAGNTLASTSTICHTGHSDPGARSAFRDNKNTEEYHTALRAVCSRVS